MEAAPEKFWKLAFPLPYRTALESNSRARGLDPYIVAALIRQESEFNPKAISWAKAYGLTQVLPSTGRQLSRRVGMTRFSPSMLFEPEINLKLGTYYLKSLLDQQDGKWEQTLASYNAGKSRADEWATWASFREPAEYHRNRPVYRDPQLHPDRAAKCARLPAAVRTYCTVRPYSRRNSVPEYSRTQYVPAFRPSAWAVACSPVRSTSLCERCFQPHQRFRLGANPVIPRL